MIHRHLDYPTGTPVDELPVAAVVDILDRGDLDDWQPLAAEIARDPHGGFADRVAELVDRYPMYGTSPLWRGFIHRCRTQRRRRQPVNLTALRHRLGLTQVELAERMGISQSDLSKLERRRDLRLSTLDSYLRAAGGNLRVVVEMPGGETEIDIGSLAR